MLCKGMMLVAFGMPMRVKRKPARMEEQECSPHEVQAHQHFFKRETAYPVLSCINENGVSIPNFYIFKGKQL